MPGVRVDRGMTDSKTIICRNSLPDPLDLRRKEAYVPLIVFEVGSGMTPEKKKELVRRLTETSAQVTGIHEDAFVIYIHENDNDNIGVGGKLLTEILAERG
jgi:4-oxalocrotonate tautomerase